MGCVKIKKTMGLQIDLHAKLKEYFGFDNFKGNQEQIIKNVLAGNNTFVLMPTGVGKSLLMQCARSAHRRELPTS